MTFAPIKGQCPVCRQDAGLNLDPIVSFSESKQLAELRAENASLKEVIGLSEDSRLMDEYLKLGRANARQAERIAELEEDIKESDAIRERCAYLLAETAVALKGPEKALHRHGWQDLPKVAQEQTTTIAAQSAVIEQAKTAMNSAKKTEGWPTDEMVRAGNEAMASPDARKHTVRGVFIAMLEAAPQPVAAQPRRSALTEMLGGWLIEKGFAMNIVICPGCGEEVPNENYGCQNCGYENNDDGRLLTLAEMLEKPSYPQPGALRLNGVCSEFLRRIVAEAMKTPNV